MKVDIDIIEEWFKKIFSYQFIENTLLITALTHPSVTGDNKKILNYERLEFLGDTVLSMIVTEILINKFVDEREGDLAKRRAALVCTDSLFKIANKIGLNEHIILSNSENSQGGRNKPSNLENCLEAIIGAVYLDGGLEAARDIIKICFGDMFDVMKEPPKDPKSMLQEWAQKNGMKIPLYTIVEQSGPIHAPVFKIQLDLDGFAPLIVEASSKKNGERLAAGKMLEQLKLI